MKLLSREPRWIAPSNWPLADQIYIGLSFACPCRTCTSENVSTKPKRLVVLFWEPIDASKKITNFDFLMPNKVDYTRLEGEDFESLTLEPGVDFSSTGHWKGTIVKGSLCDEQITAG